MKPERMQKETLKKAAAALLLTASLCVSAVLLIRNAGAVIRLFDGRESSFAAVFGQLRNARIRPAFLIPLLAWTGWLSLPLKDRMKPVCFSLLTVLIWLLLFAGTLYFTAVNGIRFGDVCRSLLSYVSNGLLDRL